MSVVERPTTMAGAQFVDPKVLARIGNLELLASTVVNGFINGLHKSPFFGASVDFAEHRGYVPGDDIRRVDWRLYARSDRYYVKQYDADSNSNFSVVLDVSKSMSFASDGPSKLEYAKYLAACLTYMSNRQRDRVGIVTFDSKIVDLVPSSAKHLEVVLHTLDRVRAGRPGSFLEPLQKMAEYFGRPGILCLISDLYDEPENIVDALRPLRFRGNDLIVFHVLDPAEVDFGFKDASSFEDLESGEQIPVVPSTLAEQYRALVKQHIATLQSRLTENRIDYALMNTSRPLDYALFSFLAARERLVRVR